MKMDIDLKDFGCDAVIYSLSLIIEKMESATIVSKKRKEKLELVPGVEYSINLLKEAIKGIEKQKNYETNNISLRTKVHESE